MKKIWNWLKAIIRKIFGGGGSWNLPAWDECTRSSNWHGSNASQRMMNMLSPGMPDNVFESYLSWIKSRGCNCCHLILANKADGMYANYSIYGNKFDFNVNQAFINVFLSRIKKIRNEGLGVVLWLMTDDSSAWAKSLAGNPQKYIDDLDKAGILKYASTVVIGLEADEYWSVSQCSAIATALRKRYSGKIGVHQTSNKCNYAGVADVFFAQMNPGSSKAQIQNFVKTCMRTGKPVNMFELERQEDRTRSQYAIEAGAYGVGNW